MHASDLEAAIAKRAALASKNEEETRSALAELGTLDLRQTKVLQNSTLLNPVSLEYVHNQVRLRAMVASGSISPLLADIANTVNPDAPEVPESYYLSREEFLSELDNNTYEGYNPYDLGGKLTRLVDRGASKADILAFLESNTFFQSQKDIIDSGVPADSLDLVSKLAVFKVKNLLEALDAVEDLSIPTDLAETAKTLVSKYDEDGHVADLIDSGASSKEILEALKGNTAWEEDAEDYLTRDDVEAPREAQRTAWNAFASVLFAIKDLD